MPRTGSAVSRLWSASVDDVDEVVLRDASGDDLARGVRDETMPVTP